MRTCEVRNVDVIAEAGTIGSRIIRAEDPDLRAPARSGVEHERNEMCFRVVVLAEFAITIRAGGIEIPQR